MNVWAALASAVRYAEEPDMYDLLVEQASKDLPTYEDYIKKSNVSDPEYAESLIKDTDPAKLAKFNALVAEFNSSRDRIIKEKDFETVTRICKEAEGVIRGSR